MRDWIRACKGGAPACSKFEIAAPYTEWLVLGSAAVRVEGKLLYDAKTGQFTNSPEANKYLKLDYRKGWEVKRVAGKGREDIRWTTRDEISGRSRWPRRRCRWPS